MLIGGSSQLGTAVAARFARANQYWRTLNVDSHPVPQVASNLPLKWGVPIESQLVPLCDHIKAFSPS